MESTDKEIGKMYLGETAISEGYGVFPYVIVRMFSAIYLQVPIRTYVGARPSWKGINVEVLDEGTELTADKLIEVVKNYKHQIESKHNAPHRLCLVVGEKEAYYFEGEDVSRNTSIPSGGTLLNLQQKPIAMNIQHFLIKDKG